MSGGASARPSRRPVRDTFHYYIASDAVFPYLDVRDFGALYALTPEAGNTRFKTKLPL